MYAVNFATGFLMLRYKVDLATSYAGSKVVSGQKHAAQLPLHPLQKRFL